MSTPLISIIIPTRNRPDTLFYSVRTCLSDPLTDFEVVVFDNASNPPVSTESLGINDRRLRIHRSEESLPMLHSWETALSLAHGQHIMVIGDDDGILPSTLSVLRKLLVDYPKLPIRWSRIAYNWPNHPYQIKQDSIKIPLSNNGFIIPSRALISAVANYKLPFFVLPMLYNSLVPRCFLEKLKTTCGKVFLGPAPDLASGFAIAYLSGSYLALDTPLAIGGVSGKSNGLATFELSKSAPNKEQAPIYKDFISLNQKAGYAYPHPLFPNLVIGPVISADSFQHVKESLFPKDTSLKVNLQQLVDNCWFEIFNQKAEDQPGMFKVLEQYVSGNSQLNLPKSQAAEALKARAGSHLLQPPRGYSEKSKILGLDAKSFGIKNVLEAAQLCEDILCYNKNGFRLEVKTPRQNLIASGRRFVADLVRRNTLPGFIYCD